ncbi:MAG: aspartyl/asparaginyl beta-hydroxylase domain-containing protein [Planctomycetes bacterium]|nr:aspartyl/asparaginyl beta-hydroxylase domain-containing protein [Planctomycetota bacterium]
MRELAAGLLSPCPVDPGRLTADAERGLAAVARFREQDSSLPGWVNLPLFNRSGAPDDYTLEAYEGSARETPLCAELPAAAELVRWVADQGLSVEVARLAVLEPGSQLRAHVDEYDRLRLIVTLNEDPAFRHVLGDLCVSFQAGELWAVDGHTCHGAANLHPHRARAALLIDARPESSRLPDWYASCWEVPPARCLSRAPWDEPARATRLAEARALLEATPTTPELSPAEAHLLSAPYSFELDHSAAYSSLVDFCRELAAEHGEPTWSERAEFWEARACRCVPLEAAGA